MSEWLQTACIQSGQLFRKQCLLELHKLLTMTTTTWLDRHELTIFFSSLKIFAFLDYSTKQQQIQFHSGHCLSGRDKTVYSTISAVPSIIIENLTRHRTQEVANIFFFAIIMHHNHYHMVIIIIIIDTVSLPLFFLTLVHWPLSPKI